MESLDEPESLDSLLEKAVSGKVYTLVSKDGKKIGNITSKLYNQSTLIMDTIQMDRGETLELEFDYNANILNLIVCYMKYHEDKPAEQIDSPIKSSNMSELVDKFDADFIDLPDETLMELTLAADYFDIPPLTDLCCAKLASYIDGKSADQIRARFGLEDDLTQAEKDQLRLENM